MYPDRCAQILIKLCKKNAQFPSMIILSSFPNKASVFSISKVRFSFSDAGPVFHMPPPCSVVIQVSSYKLFVYGIKKVHKPTE